MMTGTRVSQIIRVLAQFKLATTQTLSDIGIPSDLGDSGEDIHNDGDGRDLNYNADACAVDLFKLHICQSHEAGSMTRDCTNINIIQEFTSGAGTYM